jgi:S1-C subfamily serine protease
MHKNKKLLIWVTSVLLVIIILQSSLLYYQIDKVDKKVNTRVTDLSKAFDANMVILQNMIQTVDEDHIANEKDILDIIIEVQAESKEAVEEAKSALEKDIASIEVSGTDFSKIISSAMKSTVSVLTDRSQGSGAFITENQIVTNYHVINGASIIKVLTYDDEQLGAVIIGVNKKVDIAVLQLVDNLTYRSLELGNSDQVKVGEAVVALGNPFGFDFTATQGIISAKRTAESGLEYLQMDVPINPGNSGGPVIDSQGEIIGLANFIIQGSEGLGFAIPSNDVRDVVEDIIDGFE